jgi:hypothetical protein
MTPDPHIAILAVTTLGVGYLMAAAGLQKSALEWRRRTCPSCGKSMQARICSGCGRV